MSKTITIIVCPACQAERTIEKAMRPGAEIRCQSCKHLFVPVPVVDDDRDLPLPPPPPPGKGPPRRKKEPKELHGNFYDRIGGSRRTMCVVFGILLAGCVGLWASWYGDTVKKLDINADKAGDRYRKGIDNLAKNPSKAKIPTVAPAIVLKAKAKPDQPAKSVASSQPSTSAKTTDIANPPAPAPAPAPNRMIITPAPNRMIITPQALPPAPPPAPTKPVSVKPVDPVAEKKAAAKLHQADKLLNEGKPKLASKLKKEILEQYPDTEAAASIRGESSE